MTNRLDQKTINNSIPKITIGTSSILIPDDFRWEDIELCVCDIVKELADMDMSSNTISKMMVVDSVVKILSPDFNIYIDEYADYSVYKKLSELKDSALMELYSLYDIKSLAEFSVIYGQLAHALANILVIKRKDTVKDTTCMILDLRDGKSYYYISQK